MKPNYLLADTHAHLEHDDFAADVDAVVGRAREAGVRYLVVPVCAAADAARGLDLARRHEEVYFAAALHPNCGLPLDADEKAGLREALARGQAEGLAVAVGECGLDYHYLALPREQQLEILRWHLALARELDLPVILHQREAQEDLQRTLETEGVPPRGGVLHCFSGDAAYYRWARDRGLFVSFTGNVTFGGKARPPASSFAELELATTMLETDTPYMTPVPHRGTRNEPAYLPLVAAGVAAAAGRAGDDVAAETTLAARTFFGLPPDFGGAVVYRYRKAQYVNLTNRCTNDCSFCVRNFAAGVGGVELRLRMEPTAAEVLAALGEVAAAEEVVFCGYGEPTLRWEVVKEIARALKRRGGRVRLNTNGSAALTQGRDVTPELAGLVDRVSVSVNAPDAAAYQRLCRPGAPGEEAWRAVEEFVQGARRHVPEVVVTAVAEEAVAPEAMEALARRWGVGFRLRRAARP
ncbi:MAG: TatD family hydrolase [Candidatus Coatesbacteria bacterium]|nr:MAG: TatD family hydrolase [Candidatus Coatesbacteria bacterium]